MLTARIADLRRSLEAHADPTRAEAMSVYMRNRCPFLGVPSPRRREAATSFIAAGANVGSDELLDAADVLWGEPEREFQYVAVDLLSRHAGRLRPHDLSRVAALITTSSWWDTVDALAANVVGPLVRANPDLGRTMDRWIDDDDIWIARAALLHQLRYRSDTDAERLFAHVERRAADSEFFIRKACGWALREYGKHDPEAVREFVDDRRDVLSALTIREATKHL